MAVEIWQITIPNRKSKGLLVTAAPVSNPTEMTYLGPYSNLKEARLDIEKIWPVGDWVTARRYYTKVENDAPWD